MTKNIQKSLEYFKKLSKKDHSASQIALVIAANSETEIEITKDEILILMRKSASKGN